MENFQETGVIIQEEAELELETRYKFVPSKIPQVLASLAISIGAFAVGAVCAWSAPCLPEIEEEFTKKYGEFDSSDSSWIASAATLGALLGAFPAGFLIEKFGRKKTVLIICPPFLFGWLLLAFAPTIFIMKLARLITGICIGSLSLAIPVYIGEVSDQKIRGILSNFFPIFAGVGILFIYILGSFLNWFAITLVCSTIPILLFICMYFMPESPTYLISKGITNPRIKTSAALSLRWLRGASTIEQIETELNQLRCSIESTSHIKLSAKEFFSRSVLKPQLITMSLMFFQQLSGINCIVFFAFEIFKDSGTNIGASLSSIIVALVIILSVVVSTFLIDLSGRRVLLGISGVGMAFSLMGLGTFFLMKSQNNNQVPEGLSWLPLTSLLLYVTSFNFGFGPCPWVLLGEILPTHVKGIGSALTTSFTWFLAFLVTKSFQDFMNTFGACTCYYMFGIISALGAIFTFFIVPETKEKTLEEIQKIFK